MADWQGKKQMCVDVCVDACDADETLPSRLVAGPATRSRQNSEPINGCSAPASAVHALEEKKERQEPWASQLANIHLAFPVSAGDAVVVFYMRTHWWR